MNSFIHYVVVVFHSCHDPFPFFISLAIQRSRKPVPTFGRARQTAESTYMNFGVDYAKPQVQPQTHAKKPASRPRPPPVNRRDDDELDSQPWSNTLKGESQLLKPWEREALEAERYQSGTVDQPYRPHTQQPPTAPKPKITQISAQSTARPAESQLSPSAGYRSVSPSVPPKPTRSPASPAHQSPSLQQLSPYANNDVSGGYGQGGAPNIVHLQYNSPMGLYSRDNVMDTYVGQTQGRALSPS